MRVERLVVQVLCHATEDEEKVMRAVENVVGAGAMERMRVSSQSLKGHYGDPVALIRLSAVDSETAGKILFNVLAKLSDYERMEAVREGLNRGRHGGKLYLRLDKQAAYLGALRLSDRDSIRIEAGIRGSLEKFLKEAGVEDE